MERRIRGRFPQTYHRAGTHAAGSCGNRTVRGHAGACRASARARAGRHAALAGTRSAGMSIVLRARAEIRALTPYSSARMEASGGSVMLNANESPYDSGLNRYPDPQPAQLVAGLAQLYGALPEQVLAGRGSDEAIDLLVR